MKLRNLLYLGFIGAASAFASTISFSTSVSCAGSPSGGGGWVSHASCSYQEPMFGFYSSAQANVSVTSTGASVSAFADAFHMSASASAAYSALLTITVYGGTGIGYLYPTTSRSSWGPSGDISDGSFTGTMTTPANAPCANIAIPPEIGGCSAFVFGEPQVFTLSLYAAAAYTPRTGTAITQFTNSFRFWDANGNEISNVTYTLEGLDPLQSPEPGPGISLLIAGMLFASRAVGRRRFGAPSIRTALSLLICFGLMGASTAHGTAFSTSVNCSGVRAGGAYQPVASCHAIGRYGESYASARVSASSGGAAVSASADAYGPTPADASAGYSAVLTITIYGGSGYGYLVPSISSGTFGSPGGYSGGGFAGALPLPADAPCIGLLGCSLFAFETPQTFTLSLFAAASRSNNSSATASAGFTNAFRFWNADGNEISNVSYSLDGLGPLQVPEPLPAASLLLASVLFVIRATGGAFRGTKSRR